MPRWNPFAVQLILPSFIVLTLSIPQNSNSKDDLLNVDVTKNLSSMPLSFTANHGQWDEKVKFRANSGGATMWFVPDGAYYQLIRTIAPKLISIVDKRYGCKIRI